MRGALIDSSAFLSLEDPDERSHDRVKSAFRSLVDERTPLLTTNFVFDEAYTLLLTRLGRSRAVAWGQSLLDGELVGFLRVDEEHEIRAWQIILEFEDKDFSFTDATTFAVAEALEIATALSLDRHFAQYGRFIVLP